MALTRSLALALVCLAILLLVFAGLPFPTYHLSWLIATVPLSIAGVLGWAITIARPKAIPSGLVLAAVLVVAAAALAANASSRPGVALPTTWKIASGAGTALLIWHAAARRRSRRDLLAIAGMFLVLLVGVYLGQVVGHWAEWLRLGMPGGQLPLRPANDGGLAGVPTWLADDVLLLLPLVLAAIGWSTHPRRLGALALLVAALAAVAISGTRSLWLIALALTLIFGLPAIRRRGVGTRQIAIGAAAVVAVGALAAWRFDLVGRLARDVDAGRSSAFASAVTQGLSSPLVGTGPGTYPMERLETEIAVFAHYAFPNAHNLVLNSFAELGFVGLALVLVAAALLARQAWRRYIEAGDRRPMVAGAALGVLIVVAHAMVDVVIDVPGIFVLTAIVSSFALVPEPAQPASPGSAGPRWSIPRFGAIAAIGVMVICLPSLLILERNIRLVEQARDFLRDRPDVSLTLARQAQDGSPGFAPAVLLEMQAADATGDVPAAIDAGRRAVELDGLPQHLIALAVLYARDGNLPMAREWLEPALARDRVDPFLRLNAAVLLADTDPTGSLGALIGWLDLDSTGALVADSLPDALRSQLGAAGEGAARRRAEAGDYDGALLISLELLPQAAVSDLIGESPEVLRPWLAAVSQAWAGSAQGLADLEAMAAASPTLARAQTVWTMAALTCNVPAMERWAAVYRLLGNGSDPSIPLRLGPAPEVRAPMTPTLYPAAVWGTGTPTAPYVSGTFTVERGVPECAS